MSRVRYIISVIQITDIGEGVIVPGTGQARFKCRYTAVVMKPFKGETVDGKVVNVNKMGFFAMVGPLQVFVSSHVSGSVVSLDLSWFPPFLRIEDGRVRVTAEDRLSTPLRFPQSALLPLPISPDDGSFCLSPLSILHFHLPPLSPPLPDVMNAMHRDNRPFGMLIYAGKMIL